MKWPSWVYRLVPYLGRRQAEEDLQEELRLHLELERERHRDAGLSEADAQRAARRRLGNGTLIRERTRDVWGWRWLDDLGRDARHAVRSLGRSPGFAAAVVLVLALGTGANAAMFGIVYGVLLRAAALPGGRRNRAHRRVVRGDRHIRHVAVQPLDAPARGERRVVRAARRLPGALGGVGDPGRRHPVRRPGLAVAVPAAADGAAPGSALHGGGSKSRRGPRRAAEPRRLDESLRVGSGHRRDPGRSRRRPAHRRRRARRGFLLSESGQRVLDALRHSAVHAAEHGRPGGAACSPLGRVQRARAAPSRRVAGAGRYGSPHHPAAEQRRAHRAGGCESAGRRASRGRRPRGSAAGGDGRRVSARAAGAGRGDGAGAADRLHQRRGAACSARCDPPADARRLRRARRGQGPVGAAAPDRERRAEPERGRARPGRGGHRPAGGARARSGRSRAARRGGNRHGGARVHRGAVDRRRAAVRRGAGVPMVAGPSGARVERGRCAVRGGLQAAAVEPGARGAGHRAGGAHACAADRHGVAAAQLRATRNVRPRLRPGQRGQHNGSQPDAEPAIDDAGSVSRNEGITSPIPGTASRRDDGKAGASPGCRSVRVVVELAPRNEPRKQCAAPSGRYTLAGRSERFRGDEVSGHEPRLFRGDGIPPPCRSYL